MRRVALLLVAVMAIALTGCGDDDVSTTDEAKLDVFCDAYAHWKDAKVDTDRASEVQSAQKGWQDQRRNLRTARQNRPGDIADDFDAWVGSFDVVYELADRSDWDRAKMVDEATAKERDALATFAAIDDELAREDRPGSIVVKYVRDNCSEGLVSDTEHPVVSTP